MEPGGVHTGVPAAVCTPGSTGLHTRVSGVHTQLTPHAHPYSHRHTDRRLSLPARVGVPWSPAQAARPCTRSTPRGAARAHSRPAGGGEGSPGGSPQRRPVPPPAERLRRVAMCTVAGRRWRRGVHTLLRPGATRPGTAGPGVSGGGAVHGSGSPPPGTMPGVQTAARVAAVQVVQGVPVRLWGTLPPPRRSVRGGTTSQRRDAL
jgi:hypothetical protein